MRSGRRAPRVLATAIVLALFTAGCGDDDGGAPATPDPGADGDARTTDPAPDDPAPADAPACAPASLAGVDDLEGEHGRTTVEHGGEERAYLLAAPAEAAAGTEAVGLVLNLHGFSSNATAQAVYSDLPERGTAAGFAIATPEGIGSPQQWRFGDTAPGGDLELASALVDDVARRVCIDRDRVYATGISNGGAMSASLGCLVEEPSFAAIAPVAGIFFPNACAGRPPVSLIAFHGTADRAARFEGGAREADGFVTPGVRATVAQWAEHAGCDPDPEVDRVADDVAREHHPACPEGVAVELYVVEDGGHTWPGSFEVPGLGRVTDGISATDLMLEFFAAHPGPG